VRIRLRAVALVLIALAAGQVAPPASAQAVPQAPSAQDAAPAVTFDEWLAAVRTEALTSGISQKTVDAALGSVERLPIVVERDRTQAEVTLDLNLYLRRRLTPRVIRSAREEARRYRADLAKVTAQYGVPGPVIMAIWGMESNFGRFQGVRPTIPALATLAYDGRRRELFRNELFAALRILDRGDIGPDALKGSWAGAMGQVQFMPSSYLEYAVDADGDGRRDIWASMPDVFGSIANYLKAHGWVPGTRWGREVRLTDAVAARVAAEVPIRMAGPCRAVRDLSEPRPLTAWRTLGVTQRSGALLPRSELAASLARVDRRTFLVYANYEALLAYNCANTYALSVAVLADRLGAR